MRCAAILLSLALGQTSGFDTDVTIPTGAHAIAEAKAEGVQIYTCQAQGLTYGWGFKAPEATLTEASGQVMGTHGAGPMWVAADGSAVRGKVVAEKVAADPLSVPWLLLAATPEPGKHGRLDTVTFVRRWDTRGGVAPVDGCDAGHAGAEMRVPYRATYTFFAPDGK